MGFKRNTFLIKCKIIFYTMTIYPSDGIRKGQGVDNGLAFETVLKAF
jgi:hypothetical protein